MNSLIFDENDRTRFRTLIEQAQRLVIISHTNPDGDAIGSALGSWHILSPMVPQAVVVLPNRCSETFRYLPGSDAIVDADTDMALCEQYLAEADLIIGIDFNQLSRVDRLQNALAKAGAKKVLIDHHHNPDREAFSPVFSCKEASSACEVAFWLYTAIWGRECINDSAARCLYNGICTDTGSFSFSNEHPSLHYTAAELVSHPIGAADIHNHINNTFSFNRIQLFGFAITQRLRIFKDKHMAYFYISLDDLKQFNADAADLEGLVNYTLMMKEIEVGALVREEVGRTKISLRAKYDFDVNVFARTHFGGGGHTKAAGATVNDTFQNTINKLETLLLKEI